jgi:hypothetical protein
VGKGQPLDGEESSAGHPDSARSPASPSTTAAICTSASSSRASSPRSRTANGRTCRCRSRQAPPSTRTTARSTSRPGRSRTVTGQCWRVGRRRRPGLEDPRILSGEHSRAADSGEVLRAAAGCQ